MPILISPLLPFHSKDNEYPLITTVGPRHLRVQAWSDAILGRHYRFNESTYDAPSCAWYEPNKTQVQWHLHTLHFTTQLLANKDVSRYNEKERVVVVVGLIDILLFPMFSYLFIRYSSFFTDVGYLTMQLSYQMHETAVTNGHFFLYASYGVLSLIFFILTILFYALSAAFAIPGLILESLRCCIGYSLIHLITTLTIPKEIDMQGVDTAKWSSITSCILDNGLCNLTDLPCEHLSNDYDNNYLAYRNRLFGFHYDYQQPNNYHYPQTWEGKIKEGISILKELKTKNQSVSDLDRYIQQLARGQSETESQQTQNQKPSDSQLELSEEYLKHFNQMYGMYLYLLLHHDIPAFQFIENYQILKNKGIKHLICLYQDQNDNPLFVKLMKIRSEHLSVALDEIIPLCTTYMASSPSEALSAKNQGTFYKRKTDTGDDFLTACAPTLDRYIDDNLHVLK